jgi:tRNA pseudouridine(55) synthase
MSKKREERKNKRVEKEKLEKNKKFSKVFFLDKKVSQTPLELLEVFQKTKKFFKWQKKAEKICKKRSGNKQGCAKVPLAYAGRLDPMAEGKMLILAGEACKERERYLSLDKEYVFEVLLGFSSDTKDILGLVKKHEGFYNKKNFSDFMGRYFYVIYLQKKLEKILEKMIGKRHMEYPVFSSKAVGGKPLFLWALEKKLDQIKIPKKEVEIYKINLQKVYFVKKEKMIKNIFSKINNLKKVEEESKKLGEDFRRVEVLQSWQNSLREFCPNQKFLILKIKTRVSSGTYMRSLAQEVGESLGTTGLAYSIKRTRFFDK